MSPKNKNMNLVIIGAGYVGLVSAACFAKFGANVTCIDKDQKKIDLLNRGQVPIYEPGLEELITEHRKTGRLAFSSNNTDAISQADLIFLAVGTPTRPTDGHADLSYVHAAAEEIALSLSGYTLIVDKSTVPVGTGKQVARIIRETNPGADFDVASNPEFMREGVAINDFLQPERIVLGFETERAEKLLLDLYQPLRDAEVPIVLTNLESAELIKYASNAFLATKISFINEMSQLCETVGANIDAVSLGMGLDSRIGSRNLQAGPGFGGSCFPKDILALSRLAQEQGVSCHIVESVVEVNATQKAKMVQKIRQAFGGSETGKKITVLGLTFKPDTDDMREAPSLSILPPLNDMGAIITAHDPQGIQSARPLLPESIKYADNPYEAATDADAVVIITDWEIYRELDLEKMKKRMTGTIFVDLRNLFDPGTMKEYGFDYYSVGR